MVAELFIELLIGIGGDPEFQEMLDLGVCKVLRHIVKFFNQIDQRSEMIAQGDPYCLCLDKGSSPFEGMAMATQS
jgi:hypothetical protein